MSVTLQVSIGEALDKHTILILKQKYVKDEKKLIEIQKEISMLNEKLSDLIEKYSYQYKCLLTINEEIWLDQDRFRVEKDEKRHELCNKIIVDNDRRFRVKNKLNILHSSDIKEQKSYTQKKAFIFTHLGMGDMFTMNGAVRLISTYYDNTTVVCKKIYEKSVKEMYADDFSITFYAIEKYEEHFLSPLTLSKVRSIAGDADLYLSGLHKINGNVQIHPWNAEQQQCKYFFESFYNDINLSFINRKLYQHINRNIEIENKLYNKIKSFNTPYVFVHDETYNLKINVLQEYLEKDDTIVFNPNKNFYENKPSHKFYSIWEGIFNILDYCKIIENADQLYLTDSSFYCLACCLNLKNNQIRKVYSRQGSIDFHKKYDGGLFDSYF